MAKSYYKKIQGVRYDRALLESAEERIKGQGDGRISDQDIKEIIDLSKDGNKVTLTELRTIKYISCLLYTSPSPRDYAASRMPSSA